MCELWSLGAGAAAVLLLCALGSLGAGAAAGRRYCARLGAWVLVLLQGAAAVCAAAAVRTWELGGCRWLVPLQGAPAVCTWELGWWCCCCRVPRTMSCDVFRGFANSRQLERNDSNLSWGLCWRNLARDSFLSNSALVGLCSVSRCDGGVGSESLIFKFAHISFQCVVCSPIPQDCQGTEMLIVGVICTLYPIVVVWATWMYIIRVVTQRFSCGKCQCSLGWPPGSNTLYKW